MHVLHTLYTHTQGTNPLWVVYSWAIHQEFIVLWVAEPVDESACIVCLGVAILINNHGDLKTGTFGPPR